MGNLLRAPCVFAKWVLVALGVLGWLLIVPLLELVRSGIERCRKGGRRAVARPGRDVRGAVTVVGIAALLTGVVPHAAGRPAATGAVVIAVADTWAGSTAPGVHGREQRLTVGGRGSARAYLRFRLTAPPAGIGAAVLRVFAQAATARLEVSAVPGASWSERSLTFRNAPRSSPRKTASGAVRRGAWLSVDVTHLVGRGTSVSFALSSPDRAIVRLSSREARGRAPRLVISPAPAQPALPLRAAFYYPWFPEAWSQHGVTPFTRYTPALGLYNSSAESVIEQHVEAMEYARIEAGIASWWGRGHRTNERFETLLSATRRTSSRFRWAVYYEPEGQGDPNVSRLRSDLGYLVRRFGAQPRYLRVDGRPIVFVYGDTRDGCGMATRWKQANTVGAYVVLKVFPGYRDCPDQPDGWHQYAPSVAADEQLPDSFAISPGFHHALEPTARLPRDLARWRRDVAAMTASGARFQLVQTFNEWGEGTSVEAARQWQTRSGYGAYLDALRGVATGPPPPPSPPPAPGAAVLLAAGDVASCGSGGDERTAALLDSLSGTIAVLGDLAYERGTAAEFAECYAPSWGRHKTRTRPAPGNHEYVTAGAAAYFDYFGAAAGPGRRGYYSYDLGSWHVVALNSNCSKVDGCERGSPQERWLRADLAAHPSRCVVAYWHHPRFSSGQHGSHDSMQAMWQTLADAGADLVLAGHDHDYERFAPLDGAGRPSTRGIRSFVVGTGGKNHYPIDKQPLPHSVVRNDDTFGLLKLGLAAGSYTWEFVAEPGKRFADRGSGTCH